MPILRSPAIRCENASGAAMFHAGGKRPPKEGQTAAEGGAAAVVRAARSMHEARMKCGRAGSVSWCMKRCVSVLVVRMCVWCVLCTATLSLDLCFSYALRARRCARKHARKRARKICAQLVPVDQHSFSGTLDDPEKLTFAPEIETHRSRMPKAR
jgi:hypothetical protein